ncbi:MAG: molecular chaperone DnaK [Candidatus Aminicenantaceae bacterium]
MAQTIGIDLGTTYSCMAFLEGAEPRVIPNIDGMIITPSVVSYTSSGERIVGNLALRQAVTNPKNTIYAVKRLMGRKMNSNEVVESTYRIPYDLLGAKNGDVMVQAGGKTISPQEVSSHIIDYLKKSAEAHLGEEVTEAVVTVPAHFNDHQRQATKDSAKIAGLNVIRIINEPTSACLAYGIDKKDESIVAVYDIGGGTFDITVMEVNNGIFHVLATNGNTYLGGEDFDNKIVDWILSEFKEKYNLDLFKDKLAMQRIKETSEKAKRELSFSQETEINLPFICSDESGSKHIKTTVTREKLEELTNDLVLSTIPYLEQVLKDGKLKKEDVDEIILVGGQARMPLIKQTVHDFFRKESSKNINPDEIIAIGASIQAGILKGILKEGAVLLDVTPLSLGIEAEKDQFVKIIEKNTTIPTTEVMPFTTTEDHQRTAKIHVLQGESELASENRSLAVFKLVGIESAEAGIPQIDIQFSIDADGIVKVSAKDVATGREQNIEVNPSSGLEAEEIKNIIQGKQVNKQKEYRHE